MPILLIAIFAIAALAYVAAPLRRNYGTELVDPMAELEEKKIAALHAILDLESERDVGKLTTSDFEELRAVYEAEALDALNQIDGVVSGDGNDSLEEEIARIRQRLSGAIACPKCGAERVAGEQPCPACGA